MSKREGGKLPSQPVPNPKTQYSMGNAPFEHVQAIHAVTTRRQAAEGRVSADSSEGVIGQEVVTEEVSHESDEVEKNQRGVESEKSAKGGDGIPPPSLIVKPRVPFPSVLQGPSPFEKGNKVEEMLETFRQVKINLPLLEAIKQIPAYAKFLKDLCTHKRKSRPKKADTVYILENASSILTRTTPQKFKDPGAPTIPCVIGTHTIDRALLDLGASVNLLPYSVYLQLGLGELKPTAVKLQLADRSVKVPRGIIEDVLVQVDKFFFPVDFLVLDTEPVRDPTKHIPVILGRPFLATANACISCRSGVMEIAFGNMKVKLNIFSTVRPPQVESEDECFAIDVIDGIVEEDVPTFLCDAPLKESLLHFNPNSFEMAPSPPLSPLVDEVTFEHNVADLDLVDPIYPPD